MQNTVQIDPTVTHVTQNSVNSYSELFKNLDKLRYDLNKDYLDFFFCHQLDINEDAWMPRKSHSPETIPEQLLNVYDSFTLNEQNAR